MIPRVRRYLSQALLQGGWLHPGDSHIFLESCCLFFPPLSRACVHCFACRSVNAGARGHGWPATLTQASGTEEVRVCVNLNAWIVLVSMSSVACSSRLSQSLFECSESTCFVAAGAREAIHGSGFQCPVTRKHERPWIKCRCFTKHPCSWRSSAREQLCPFPRG